MVVVVLVYAWFVDLKEVPGRDVGSSPLCKLHIYENGRWLRIERFMQL